MSGAAFLRAAVDLSFALMAAAIALMFARLILGPTAPDRVVALDALSVLAVGMTVSLGIDMDEPVLVRVAIVVALIAFMGTVAFGYYIGKGGRP